MKIPSVGTAWFAKFLLLLLLPADALQAQFTFVTNNGAITITGYGGPGGAVVIPSSTNGLPVTSIGDGAFYRPSYNYSLTSVTIPDGVTYIGSYAFGNQLGLTSVVIPSSATNIGGFAFYYCSSLTSVAIPDGCTSIWPRTFYFCTGLTSVTLPNSITSIGEFAFHDCYSVTNLTIPSGVTNIGDGAFEACFKVGNFTIPNGVPNIGGFTFNRCTSLANITIPNTVTNIGYAAFYSCSSLTNVTLGSGLANIGGSAFWNCPNLKAGYSRGNAPSLDPDVFVGDNSSTVYYLPGTTGWGPTFGGRPTAPWLPQVQTSDASFGVRTNQIGFNIAWASGQVVVVEGCTNLANPVWSPLQTNTLSGDSLYFSDPQWTNYPARFYHVRSP